MKGLVFALLSLGLITPAHSQYAAANSSHGATPNRVASISVNLAKTGYTVPANFVGYSLNTNTFVNGLLSGAGSLCSLMSLVGSNGILRIGGLDQDTVTPPNVTSQLATNLAAFVACLGAGWTTLYGLDGVANNSTTATSQASLLATALGVTKVTFQFTNEPVDGSNFTTTSFQTMWNAYYSAVSAGVSGVQVAAWDDGDFGLTQTAIAGLTGGIATLKYVTQHHYNPPCATAMQAPALIASVALYNYQANASWAAANGKPQLLTETNTICGGGASGTSDRMMATAWYVNMAITFANNGWNGVNLHNNLWTVTGASSKVNGAVTPNIYGAILGNQDGTYSPGAVFYGLYLFSKIEGQQTASLAIGGNSSLNAIATVGGGGNANILAVNNDAVNSVALTPDQSSAWTTANVLQVKGNSGCSEALPTVGGAAIGASGAWSGASTPISKGQSITLGPCESALIQIQP